MSMKTTENNYDKKIAEAQIEEYLDEKDNKPWTRLEGGNRAATKFMCVECGICVAEEDDRGQHRCSYCGRLVDIIVL